MAIIEISAEKHQHLRIKPTRSLEYFSRRHLLLIRADEATKAACNMPVMLTSVAESGQWSLSGVASFEPESTLFVRDEKWSATFIPWQLQTWPFNLLPTEDQENPYVIAMDDSSGIFSETEGEPLFDKHAQPSIMLARVKSLLEAQLNADIQTVQFTREMISLGLNKSLTIKVEYQDGTVNSIQGLQTVDEEKLGKLDNDTFNRLRQKGYLTVIYALLFSLYQFNALIQAHNHSRANPIAKINMQLSKDKDDYHNL